MMVRQHASLVRGCGRQPARNLNPSYAVPKMNRDKALHDRHHDAEAVLACLCYRESATNEL
jgi:hypothetical protein